MINFRPTKRLSDLDELKEEYMDNTSAPLDGMWLSGFVPIAKHFSICKDDQIIGFFCLNDEKFLLEFHVNASFKNHSQEIFSQLLQEDKIILAGAFASTAETDYFCLCLDNFQHFDVHTYMYQLNESLKVDTLQAGTLPATALQEADFALASMEQLADVAAFAHANLEDAPIEWLRFYYTNLMKRREVFALIRQDKIVALGELRKSHTYQQEYVDLGVIVDKSRRGQGIASDTLKELISIAKRQKLRPICSTEINNIASQKAIQKAGFSAKNRIVKFTHIKR